MEKRVGADPRHLPVEKDATFFHVKTDVTVQKAPYRECAGAGLGDGPALAGYFVDVNGIARLNGNERVRSGRQI